jgi:uncharacterized protein DUF4398
LVNTSPRETFRLTILALLVGASCPLQANPATAPYAGEQLDFAQSELDAARQALQTHDYELARLLAAQAQLDARLAWGMTESAFLRRDALEVARQAHRLRTQGVLSTGIRSTP